MGAPQGFSAMEFAEVRPTTYVQILYIGIYDTTYKLYDHHHRLSQL